jgi:hypothetical protein
MSLLVEYKQYAVVLVVNQQQVMYFNIKVNFVD